MTHTTLPGRFLKSSDPGFEAAVLATLFNKIDPGRRPDYIVWPENVDEVVQIVRFARRQGLRIAVCSGGHSWSANHLRPGSVLVSMARFDQYEIDRDALRATAGPAVGGSKLLGALMKIGLFFPAGHCRGVCIGGYLLQGGFAWNGRKLGLACESVLGLDIVTADGELVHASATENSALYWAARGAGGGFFGIVVRFHLRLYPKPAYCGMLSHVFGIRHLEDVFRWAYEVGPDVPPAVEFQMLMSRKTLGYFPPGIEAVAPVFADTREELEAATAFMHRSPIRKKAFFRTAFVPMPISWMYRLVMTHYPEKHCWNVDNMWTRAPVDQLLPFLKEIARTLPPAPAHLLWLNWQPPHQRPDMAFSVEDQVYIALYGSWASARDTPRYGDWATNWMQEMAHLSSGIQLADENLHHRTGRFLTDEHLRQLDAIREKRDPGQVFFEWHSRP